VGEREADVAERVRKAYEKAKKKRENEQALYQRIFAKYMLSWRIYFAALLAIISLFVMVLLVYDFVMPGDISVKPILEKTTTQHGNSWYNDYRIHVDGVSIPVSLDFFAACKTGKPVMLERGHFFGEIKYLYTQTDNYVMPEEPISFFNDAWLFFVLLLCLPLVSFFFMKPKFIFVFFFVHYNLYLQPLVLLYLLLGNARIFHILDILLH